MRPGIERELWDRCTNHAKMPQIKGESPRDIIADMLARGVIDSAKQAWATLTKWEDAGLYDCGVSGDLGWIVMGAEMPARISDRELARHRKNREAGEQGKRDRSASEANRGAGTARSLVMTLSGKYQ